MAAVTEGADIHSTITCQTCGHVWHTSEETALLLESIELHAATHVEDFAWPPRIYLRADETVDEGGG